jgi:GTP-binding protein
MKDLVDITIESGSGGEGLIAFDSWRKATGGNGGKGGDVYVVGSTNYFDFSHLEKRSSLKAENGERGEKNKRNGKNGKDLIIYVPLVTKIFNPDGSEVITLYKDGDKVKLLEGGEGGLGNYALRGEGWDGKLSRKRALKGERKSFKLELNLRADAIFLGYPNAGKSSIINALTNAKYKVAEYEFTTLDPQLAVMDHYILMDLPGLIEGTSEGKGLGTKFLKHTKYSKLLVHCISLENSDLKGAYLKMREEFKSISKELEMMKEFVVFTKADFLSLEDLEKLKENLKKDFDDFLVISVYRDEDLKLLKEELKERLSSTSDTTI